MTFFPDFDYEEVNKKPRDELEELLKKLKNELESTRAKGKWLEEQIVTVEKALGGK